MGLLPSRNIIEMCKEAGFISAGITKPVSTKFATEFINWLDEGKHGEMTWLANNVEIRLNPSQLMAGAQSIICVADRYAHATGNQWPDSGGLIARYAYGSDYHKQIKKRLHKICDTLAMETGEDFRACVDTAPLLEREIAANAGIGSIGKNTLLLEKGVGSWFFLGAIVTTAKIETTEHPPIDPCGTCTQCIDACPTKAITPWSVDATKCISYLTIEHRSLIDPQFFEPIGQWIFGCDICQEVCPHNQETVKGRGVQVNEAYLSERTSLNVLEVMNWDEKQYRETFRGSSMKRAKLGMIRRNAIIVAGNLMSDSKNDPFLQSIRIIAQDTNELPLVRETAIEVLERRSTK